MNNQVKKQKSELARLQNNLLDQDELLKKIEYEIFTTTEVSEQAMFKGDLDAFTEAENKNAINERKKEKVTNYIKDLKAKIDNQNQAVAAAEKQVLRDKFADTQQAKLDDIEKPYKAALKALQQSSSAVQILRDVLEEHGLSNDEYLTACMASDLRQSSRESFKSEYINHNWKTFLEVQSIEDGKLSQYYEPQDKTPSFDKAFQSLFLKPLLNQIDGLRAGILDIPEVRPEPVEAKPIPKVVRKTIDVLQHFYVIYENKSFEVVDKAFYAFHQYSVLEAVADSAIDAGYALDTKDPEYQDKLKRYNLTVTDKPIMEHEVSMKNTPNLGDPAGFLSNSED